MPNQYDKIIRENLEALVLPLLDMLVGIVPKTLKPLSGEFQETIERKGEKLINKSRQCP